MTTTVDLDKTTPKWPEALIDLTARRITISGVTTTLTDTDVRAEAVGLVARQAQAAGHPIRAKATTADGWVQRMIVTENGQVELVGKRPAPPPAPKTGKAKPTQGGTTPAAPLKRTGRFSQVPRWFRWAIAGAAALMVLGVAVIILAGGRKHDDTPASTTPPIPLAGEVYTETPPPGWSTHAAWVVQLAPRAPKPVTDPGTGFTAAVTPTDLSAPGLGPFNDGDLFLSVLAADGHTVWAAPLDRIPTFGPVLSQVDGVTSVVIVEQRTTTYWPITGGAPVVIDMPAGARATPNPGGAVLFTIGPKAGYLSGGQMQTVEVLPLTKALAAIDGGVLEWQADRQVWWLVSATAPPARTVVNADIAALVLKHPTPRPKPGELVPTGHTEQLLMVVSAGRLYALTRGQ